MDGVVVLADVVGGWVVVGALVQETQVPTRMTILRLTQINSVLSVDDTYTLIPDCDRDNTSLIVYYLSSFLWNVSYMITARLTKQTV